MQKKITSKDLTVLFLLVLLFIFILLTMYQIDRQWQKLAQLEQHLSEQNQDMRALRRLVSDLPDSIAQRYPINQPQTIAQTPNNTAVVAKANSQNAQSAVPAAFQRAYQATQKDDYAKGDWQINSMATSLKTITPLVSTDYYASVVQSYVLESLLTRDPNTLEWSGLLAKDWQVSEDGLTYTFQLRDNIYFSDGEKLDANDVVFTFNFIMNEKIKAPRDRAYYEKLASVTANNDYEVTFTFKEPYFKALSLAGGMSILAEHFYSPYLDEPETFNQSKGLLLGTGPYRLIDAKNWRSDQSHVELIRNERYWGAVEPSYDKIVWKVIQNASARLATYRNGELDHYGARPIEYQKLKNDKQITEKSQNFEYMSPLASYAYIGWNQQRKNQATFFADKRVRQAMTFLTNRQKIIDEIYLGYAEVAVSPFSPRSKQHDPTLKARPYDLNKAKQLLTQAGYADRDGDGVIENAEGKPFSFNLTFFKDNEDTKRMVLLLKDLYAQAGIELKPDPQEWPVMLEKLDKKDFDAITLAWTSSIEGDLYQIFHSSQAKTNGDNFIGFENKDLDKLIDKARLTVNENQRLPLWQAAENILYDEQPYTFLTRRKTLVFYDNRIKNIEMTKMDLNTQFLPLETYVPAALQKYAP